MRKTIAFLVVFLLASAAGIASAQSSPPAGSSPTGSYQSWNGWAWWVLRPQGLQEGCNITEPWWTYSHNVTVRVYSPLGSTHGRWRVNGCDTGPLSRRGPNQGACGLWQGGYWMDGSDWITADLFDPYGLGGWNAYQIEFDSEPVSGASSTYLGMPPRANFYYYQDCCAEMFIKASIPRDPPYGGEWQVWRCTTTTAACNYRPYSDDANWTKIHEERYSHGPTNLAFDGTFCGALSTHSDICLMHEWGYQTSPVPYLANAGEAFALTFGWD